MKLIYCAAGNARLADIASAAGYHLGAQLPGTVYRPIYFADQDWKRPDRAAYMAALATHRPTMATVLDWERSEQLAEVLDWAEEAAQWVERVLLIPKVAGGIAHLPRVIGGRPVVLAYSVPTAYGGTGVPLWEFTGWPVHLLGGSPHGQMRIARYLDVWSADGNMAQKMAHKGRFWDTRLSPKSDHWWSLREAGYGSITEDVPAHAFARSCANIIAAWQTLTGGHVEPPDSAPVSSAA